MVSQLKSNAKSLQVFCCLWSNKVVQLVWVKYNDSLFNTCMQNWCFIAKIKSVIVELLPRIPGKTLWSTVNWLYFLCFSAVSTNYNIEGLMILYKCTVHSAFMQQWILTPKEIECVDYNGIICQYHCVVTDTVSVAIIMLVCVWIRYEVATGIASYLIPVIYLQAVTC